MLAMEGERAFLAPGAIEPEEVAGAVVTAMYEGRFLVLPHPDIANPLQVREVGVWCGIFQRDLGWSETGARRARVALREAGVVRANKLARA